MTSHGLHPPAVALLAGSTGVCGTCATLFVYPRLARTIGPRNIVRYVFPLCVGATCGLPYFALPAIVPYSIMVWSPLYLAVTSIIMFVNNAAPPVVLGRVNGVAQVRRPTCMRREAFL